MFRNFLLPLIALSTLACGGATDIPVEYDSPTASLTCPEECRLTVLMPSGDPAKMPGYGDAAIILENFRFSGSLYFEAVEGMSIDLWVIGESKSYDTVLEMVWGDLTFQYQAWTATDGSVTKTSTYQGFHGSPEGKPAYHYKVVKAE